MKKILLGAVCAAALVGPASAADLGPRTYTKAPPPTPVAAVYNWTGFYIGGHVGGAFNGDSTFGSDGRFLGGVQVGADYQFAPNWVVGIEGQYSWTGGGNNSSALYPGGAVSLDHRGLGSVTGRVGYAFGPSLLYVKGGYAYSDSSLNVSFAGLPSAYSVSGNNRDGWTVGAGLEYMFLPNLSGKIEYQYYDFGNTTFTGGPLPLIGASFRNDEHTVKAGLNYRFNWGGPVVPSY